MTEPAGAAGQEDPVHAPNPGYPYEQTHDLRVGPPLHSDLLPLLPLVGRWRGTGKGGYPTIEDFDFAQEMAFSHDGRPFLAYESRSWLIDDGGVPVRPLAREVGWWRPRPDGGLEVLLTQPTGLMELYAGRSVGTTRWDLVSDAVVRSPSAKDVTGAELVYGIVDGDLLYAMDLQAVGQKLQAHLSARLSRIAG